MLRCVSLAQRRAMRPEASDARAKTCGVARGNVTIASRRQALRSPEFGAGGPVLERAFVRARSRAPCG
eukprot:6662714-Lingulodinium_polyedra.AAC.1